jgi:SAM-dependent methyltransferase
VVGGQNGGHAQGTGVLTRYELARLAASPAFPAFDAKVRGDLRRLVRRSGVRRPAVLDVGARTSPFTVGLPVTVTVLDLPREREVQHDLQLGVTDEIVAELARRRSNVERVLLEDMTRCSEPDAAYDGVLAVEVIEHVADDEAFVAQLRRVLRPGGWAYLTTPNGDYVRNEGPDHNPDHLRLYGRDQLATLLGRHFDHVEVTYGIRTGHHRWRGQRLSVAQGPRERAGAVVANLRNRWESRAVADDPRRTANLFAVARRDP